MNALDQDVRRIGMGGHQSSRMQKDEWRTPPEIIKALGKFDLDPCASKGWVTADQHYTAEYDGLSREWNGRVWLNPPYGRHTGDWLKRLADHGNGIALIFARTETSFFFEQVWMRAAALLFIRGRLHFYSSEGRAPANAGAPSVLVAYGRNNEMALHTSGIEGRVVRL